MAVYERILRIRQSNIKIRIWIQVAHLTDEIDELREAVEKLLQVPRLWDYSPELLTLEIGNLPKVNAVEVRSGENTYLVYPEWP